MLLVPHFALLVDLVGIGEVQLLPAVVLLLLVAVWLLQVLTLLLLIRVHGDEFLLICPCANGHVAHSTIQCWLASHCLRLHLH